MAVVYRFDFAPPAAGTECVITDLEGTEVDTVTVGSTIGENGAVTCTAELEEDTYLGAVEGSFGSWQTVGVLDVVSSIEASSGGVGASDFRTDAGETANFIALGVTGATDGSDVPVTLIADDRYDALPDWCTLVDGKVDLGVDAGSVAIVALDVASLDFSGTVAPDADGLVITTLTVKVDQNQVTTGEGRQAGDGQDTQVARALAVDQAGGGLFSFVAIAQVFDAESSVIGDGVASHDIYVRMTREAFGPVEIA